MKFLARCMAAEGWTHGDLCWGPGEDRLVSHELANALARARLPFVFVPVDEPGDASALTLPPRSHTRKT